MENLPEESANCKACCHVEYDIDMPEITLPEFDGNQADWDYFTDTFKVLVHDNKAMPLAKKMHSLQGCLKSEAARIISNIPLSAKNYEIAWEQLLRHYDNPRRRLECYLQCLFEAKPLVKTSATDIIVSMVTIDQLQHSFEKLGDFKDHVYLYALKRRLDEKTRGRWERSLSDSEISTYADLKRFLLSEYPTEYPT